MPKQFLLTPEEADKLREARAKKLADLDSKESQTPPKKSSTKKTTGDDK